jgi:membrane-associated phospholipid phosphatase
MIAVLKNNWPFLLPYVLFLLAGGVLQYLYSPTEIFLYINSHFHPFSDFFFQFFTHLGDGLFFTAIVLLLLFVRFRDALIAVACFAVSSLIAQLLKRFVFADALRPKAFFENESYNLHWVEGVVVHAHNSFPSGHSTTAFSVFCLMSILAQNKLWGLFWFVLALGAAYSRVYLGQHFFGDVYAGSIIGVSTTVLLYYWLDSLFRKHQWEWQTRNLMTTKWRRVA